MAKLRESYAVRTTGVLHRNARGLSLLETLLATFMFVTVMIAMMDVWVAHARALDKSQGQEVASMLAQQVMEQELTLGYQAVNVTIPAPYIIQRTMRGVVDSEVFNYTVSAQPPTVYPNGPGTEGYDLPTLITSGYPAGPAYQVIVVNVTWFDSTGNHTLMMECDGGF